MSGDPNAQATPACPFICPLLAQGSAQGVPSGRLPRAVWRNHVLRPNPDNLRHFVPSRRSKGNPR